MSTETSCHFGHLLQVKKIYLKSDFIHLFFHDFIHVYSPGAGADSPLGTKLWCQQEHLVTSVICCKFKKISLKSALLQFFHDFIHVYSPGLGQIVPRGQSFDVNKKCLVTSFVASLKKCLCSLILYIFFMRQRQTTSRVQNFDVNGKALSLYLYPIYLVASFKEISLKSDFIHFFSWFNSCI